MARQGRLRCPACSRQFDLHKVGYTELRTRFGLTAQAAVRTIAKVADAARSTAKVCRPLPQGCSPTLRLVGLSVSCAMAQRSALWTVEGRITIPVVMGEHPEAV